jgi:hypothetical protein
MDGREQLGERGKAIWDAYQGDTLGAGDRAMVHEVARIADTLDQLARLAAGDVSTWLVIQSDELSGDIALEINGVVAERRQQQVAFKNLMLEVRQAGLKQIKPKPKDETANEDHGGDVILMFQQRARDAG